jgi:hypothetical protein
MLPFYRGVGSFPMKKHFFKDLLGWGFLVWLIGYILGIALFAVVPNALIGWIIMPVGVLITLWILLKKIHTESFFHYIRIAFVWTIIAMLFDYFFLVLLLKPADGYYKLDIYLYYGLTFLLPVAIGWYKTRMCKSPNSGV